MYFNLNVLPIKKILHAGFTTTKQEKYCEISYPCFTGETEGQRLNNLSRRGKKVTCPNFQLWFFQPPPQLCCNRFGGALEQLPHRKYLRKLNLTPSFNKTYTLMRKSLKFKQLTELKNRCSCSRDYLNSRFYTRPGDFRGAALFRKHAVPSGVSPKRTGKGINRSLQET